MVKAARPEPGRRVTRPYASSDASPAATTRTSSRGTHSTSTSGRGRPTGGRGVRGSGNGVGVDRHDVDGVDDAPSDHREGEAREEESFDRAFAALAEEMERELVMEMSPSPAPARRARFVSGHEVDQSLESEMAYSAEGLEEMPDASSFRAASRTAMGAFIEKFRGEPHAARLADDDDDDDRVASASPVFNPARGARARRLMRIGPDQATNRDASDAYRSDGGGDATPRSGGFQSRISAGADDAVAWARWGGGRGITIVETDASVPTSDLRADPLRSRRVEAGAPLDDARSQRDGEDILEAWRRRRRREAMEKGDEASAAARAAAAVAALEGDVSAGDGARDERHETMGHSGNGLGAAGPVPIAARSRSPAKTSAPTASPRSDRTSPVAAARASSVAAQTDAPYEPQVLGAESDSVTPSRARRALEFARRHPRENEDIRGDAEEDRRERLDASARALSDALAGSDGSASSPARASRASAQTSSASTSGATTPATPSPRPSPGRGSASDARRCAERAAESLDLAAAIDVTVGAALFDFDDEALGVTAAPTPAASPAEAPRDRHLFSSTGDAASVGGHGEGSAGIPTRAGLPPRPGARRGAPPSVGGDADRERRVSPSKPPRSGAPSRRGDEEKEVSAKLSPIEAVAAEVPDRPPLRPVEARPPHVGTKGARSPSVDAKAAATDAAVAAAAAAANPWLPSRVAPAAPAAPVAPAAPAAPAPPGDARSPGGRLGEEWARPEDEDDGMVVMLKARVAHLEGQIARVLAESGAARRD